MLSQRQVQSSKQVLRVHSVASPSASPLDPAYQNLAFLPSRYLPLPYRLRSGVRCQTTLPNGDDRNEGAAETQSAHFCDVFYQI